MKKLNKYIIVLVLAVFSFNLYSQESIKPMLYNPYLKNQTNHKKSTKSLMASKALPFFDDFSYASSTNTLPDQNLWVDKNVYVNTSYGFEPISIGVASFDALDANGHLYSQASKNINFSADTLTSQFINLKNRVPADSIYLSFFCQAGGFGEMPEEKDSLFLLFSQPGTKPLKWDTVWSVKSIQQQGFKQFFVAVKNESYLKDSFQFRFVNRASINIISNDPGKNTNGDIWNLDYVYLNANRTYTDSAYQEDYAIIYPPYQSMLKGFESMPWSQFKLPTVYNLVRGDKISIPVRNYRNEAVLLETEIVYYDVYDDNVEMDMIYNSSTVNPDSMFYVQDAIPNLSSDMKDSALFEVRLSIMTDVFDNPINNTVRYQQVLNNYFAYDDGTAEFGYGISGEGATNAMFAMRFETFKEEVLSSVKMFLNESIESKENNKNFYLTIWNEKMLGNRKIPGDTLYKKNLGQFNYSNDWKTFTIDTLLILPKVYYIGWVQQSDYFANIGFDKNRNASKNAFFNLQGTPEGWMQSAIDGAVMIRPVIDPKANISGTTTKSETFSIYPNPVEDVVHFNLPEEFSGKNFRIQISSITGLFNMVQEQSQDYLNIQHLQPGVYILKITKPDGSVMTSKFIKNAR